MYINIMSKIHFHKKKLNNGLRVIINEDSSTNIASINVIYAVGSRNESPSLTGLAHLTEHLMFTGSESVGNFDEALQKAAAENNAFTNNDYTSYYMALPSENLPLALYVEADRMANLLLDETSIQTQKQVVLEEYAQRYTNQPYGDLWQILRKAAYPKDHPYSWTPIGKSPTHIEKTTRNHVLEFYNKFYTPQNAILAITSPNPAQEVMMLVDEHFSWIPAKHNDSLSRDFSHYTHTSSTIEVERDVPASVIYIAFPVQGRLSPQVTVLDVATDILSSGDSSRLPNRLVKEKKIFTSINAYLTAEQGSGLLVVTGTLSPSTTMEQAQDAIWEELNELATREVSDQEIAKVRNKFEATNHFTNINSLNRTMNLAYYEFLSSASLINEVVEAYAMVTAEHIKETCSKLFTPQNATILHYYAKK